MNLRAYLPLLVLSIMVGCSTRSESYMVSVKNETNTPLTMGFTKEGEPFQDDFMAPEDIALDRQVKPELYSWGSLLPVGKRAATNKPMTAKLESDAVAYLRVYRGQLNMLEILAISRGSPSRVDVPLMPGQNDYVIVQQEGRLTAIRKP